MGDIRATSECESLLGLLVGRRGVSRTSEGGKEWNGRREKEGFVDEEVVWAESRGG